METLDDSEKALEKEGNVCTDELVQSLVQDGVYDEYVPGSLLKIRLKNFLTYESLELKPGPKLNLVIGPNGAGKSSIVCAIALGLGGKTELLSRQKAPHEFIKDGQDECSITLVIKNKHGGGSTQITRKIRRNKNNNVWIMNGETCTEKEPKQFAASLNIQVDNLCTFMPQERVAELSQMSPHEILKETERSVNSEKPLYDWHKELCSLNDKKQELLLNLEEKKNLLNKYTVNMLGMEHQMAKLNERSKLKEQIKKFEMRIKWLKYETSRLNYIEAKENRHNKKIALTKLTSQLPNLSKHLKDNEEKINSLENKSRMTQNEMYNLLDISQKDNDKLSIKDLVNKIKTSDEEIKDLYVNMCSIKARNINREEDIKCLESCVKKAEEKIKYIMAELCMPKDTNIEKLLECPIEKLDLIQSKIDTLNSEIANNMSKINEIKQRIRDIEDQCAALRDEKSKLNEELEIIDDIGKQKLDIIRKVDHDCYEAMQWIRKNSHLFENRVSDPVLIEISPKDTNFAPIIEASLNRTNLTTFVTDSRKDWHTIHEELIIKKKLRISVIDTSNFEETHFVSPMQKEELQEMGFIGYVSDIIYGPKKVIMALCSTCKLHRQPVAIRELEPDKQKKAESKDFTNFFCGTTCYTVRDAYKSVSVTAQSVRPLKWLTQRSNPERKQKLEDDVDNIIKKLDENGKAVRSLILSENSLKQKNSDLTKDRDELVSSKKQLLSLKKKMGLYFSDLNTYKMQLEFIKSSPVDISCKYNKLNDNITKTIIDKKDIIVKSINLYECYDSKISAFVEQKLSILDNCINANMYRSKLEELKNNISTHETEFLDVIGKYNKSKADAKESLSDFKDKLEKLDRAEKAAMEKFHADKSLEKLESMLLESKARLNALSGANESSKKEYEKLQTNIANSKKAINEIETVIQETNKKINAITTEWYPALVEIVKKINESFSESLDNLNCAGEIRLVKDDDFNKWKLEILVKFRDEEKLELLTMHRQSGGERSLTTILFIVSLRKISNSPICVVDEINQGMDVKNERAAHSEIVQMSCIKNMGQNFVISPKLTAGLDYCSGIRVICIYRLPKSLGQINVKGVIENKTGKLRKKLKMVA